MHTCIYIYIYMYTYIYIYICIYYILYMCLYAPPCEWPPPWRIFSSACRTNRLLSLCFAAWDFTSARALAASSRADEPNMRDEGESFGYLPKNNSFPLAAELQPCAQRQLPIAQLAAPHRSKQPEPLLRTRAEGLGVITITIIITIIVNNDNNNNNSKSNNKRGNCY